jgi:hypothetical protein
MKQAKEIYLKIGLDIPRYLEYNISMEKKEINGLQFIGITIGMVVVGFCFGLGFHASATLF